MQYVFKARANLSIVATFAPSLITTRRPWFLLNDRLPRTFMKIAKIRCLSSAVTWMDSSASREVRAAQALRKINSAGRRCSFAEFRPTLTSLESCEYLTITGAAASAAHLSCANVSDRRLYARSVNVNF